MIRELQSSRFVREKVEVLRIVASDALRDLPYAAGDDDSADFDVSLDERDVQEMYTALETMRDTPELWQPATNIWMPHTAIAALFQSTLDHYYRANDAIQSAEFGDVFGETLADDPLISQNVNWSSRLSTAVARPFKLNKRDPRWAAVLYAKALKRRKGRARFKDNRHTRVTLGEDARVLLVGDWASGIPAAVALANTMRTFLTPEYGRRDLHVIHLGDVYYAGLSAEYTKNFLAPWPVWPGEETVVKSWCLPGNHDMYSGGHGFFGMLGDARFSAQNSASYFLLENDHWQLFGLDSSYEPQDFSGDSGVLFGEQAAWMARERSAASGRKCILTTHHQPFSAYASTLQDFERRFWPILDSGGIDAWFWGHEHNCAVYQANNGVSFPVLLGHGGFPEYPKTASGGPSTTFEWKATMAGGFTSFGFAVLDFSEGTIDGRLVDEHSTVQHRFTIS